jgi:hypothetical protein
MNEYSRMILASGPRRVNTNAASVSVADAYLRRSTRVGSPPRPSPSCRARRNSNPFFWNENATHPRAFDTNRL